jgi:sugar phosphate isomerase/epimerase
VTARLPDDVGLSSGGYFVEKLGGALERIAGLTTLAEVASYEHAHSIADPANEAAAAACGLRLTVHGPFLGLDPGAVDEDVRRETVAEHRRHAEAAARVGALAYVVHPDYSDTPRVRDDAVRAALQRTIADLTALQRELELPIAVENMPGAAHSHFVAPGELDLGELGLALDVGHAAISGTLDAFLRDPRARLTHIHLHDNRGPVDDDDPHRALGQGIIDASAVLATARAAGATIILELMSEPEIAESIKYLRELGEI